MSGTRLLERRLECGLTQAELGARAGVSRQLVAAVEAGRNTPSVDAALRLARALASTAEELFADAPAPAIAALGGRLREGAALRVGRVADRLVAVELPDHGVAGAAFARPDGVLESGRLRMFAGADPTGLVMAGCDPALGIAESMLSGLGARSLLAISASTGRSLAAMARGGVHAAVVHGPAGGLPPPPGPVGRLHLARWQVGVAVAPTFRARTLQAVIGGGRPVSQRDPAAASQQAFERARTAAGLEPPPAGPRATGHLDAARTAAILDGAAVTTEGAARAFGLRFLALEEHVVEIWVARRWLDHPGALALGGLLVTRAFTERVGHLGAYDLTGCGESVAAD